MADHHGPNGNKASQNDNSMCAILEGNDIHAGGDDEVSAMDMDGSSDEDNDEMGWDVADGEAIPMVDVIAFQDDNSWGLGDSAGHTIPLATPVGKDAKALCEFREYIAGIRANAAEFTHYERTSVKLMHLLRKKGATLDTYDDVMKWHLEESGNDNPQAFISRHILLKKLAKRYNVSSDYLKERTIVLPSTGSKANIIYHDARENVVSLLTDPRFCDDDYLHFDHDPMAPPPTDLDYIADLNTGESYLETYKKLITKPGKQMLVPIIFYIDGAVTGQFDKLQIEALKMTLGIFTRKARDRQDAWRILGTLHKMISPLANKYLPNIPHHYGQCA